MRASEYAVATKIKELLLSRGDGSSSTAGQKLGVQGIGGAAGRSDSVLRRQAWKGLI